MKRNDRVRMTICGLLLAVYLASDSVAQDFKSPEVLDDGRVTLRLRAPKAESVRVSIAGKNMELQRADDNLWTVTTEPLPAGIHDYSFNVDGTRMIDPSNRNVKKWFTLGSMVEIPGNPPLLTELQNVPHGTVTRLMYPSSTVGHQRPVIVYAPPGYQATQKPLPLLLLMHGFGDDETAWTEVGRAHMIADNLIAAGKIRPCLIAMPYGHPVPPPFGPRNERPKDYFTRNADLYETDVANELLPFLKSRFRISDDRNDRSVAGLSMGGGHAIYIGLRHLDEFSAIGAFSAAAPQADKEDLETSLPALFGSKTAAREIRNFWIPIGRDDFLLKRNDSFSELLTKQGVDHDYEITDGGHSWEVWRKYLPEFLQRSFPSDDSP